MQIFFYLASYDKNRVAVNGPVLGNLSITLLMGGRTRRKFASFGRTSTYYSFYMRTNQI